MIEMHWLQVMDYWHWWSLGIVFLIMEMLLSGVFFLWMAVAAGIVGVLVLLQPGMFWRYQFLWFAVITLVSLAAWHLYLRYAPAEASRTLLNRRAEQYVGRNFVLDEAIRNGFGRIQVDDSLWRVEGPDCPAGTRVSVVGTDGVVLKVAPLEACESE